MKNLKKGFTLIELLVVIAIIGILAAVVLASLSGARTKALTAAYKAEVAGMQPNFLAQCGGASNGASFTWPTGFSKSSIVSGTCTGDSTFVVYTKSSDASTGSCNTNNATVTESAVAFPTGC